MGKYDTAMSTALGIPLGEPVLQKSDIIKFDEPKTREVAVRQSDDSEFDDVKDNLADILDKAESALETLTSLAVSEESPRAFEALNTMLNTMADINMKMIEVEERKAKLKKLRETGNDGTQTDSTSSTTVNNNVVFVGTTQDLQDQIRQRLMESK